MSLIPNQLNKRLDILEIYNVQFFHTGMLLFHLTIHMRAWYHGS